MTSPGDTLEGMTLVRCAEVAARLRHHAREPADAVLRPLGLDTEAWDRASKAWTRAIDEDVYSGDGSLVVVYSGAFVEARRRLEAGGDDLAAGPPSPAVPPP